MPKRFTILGGRGYVGSHFAKFLDRSGIEYWIPERDDRSLFERDLGCVIYCIGMTQDFAKNPIGTMDAHVAKLMSVLQNARMQSLIYLSSTRLFDGLQGRVAEKNNLHLNPETPRHLFDLSKAAGEALCCAMTTVDAIVARLSTVYDDALVGRCFLHDVVKRSLDPQVGVINMDTSLNIERDYVHIDDVCQALFLLSERHSHRIYNLASGANLSNRNLFAMIEERTGRSVRAAKEDVSLPAPIVEISRMRDEFGWQPRQVSDWLAASAFPSKR